MKRVTVSTIDRSKVTIAIVNSFTVSNGYGRYLGLISITVLFAETIDGLGSEVVSTGTIILRLR